MSQNPRVVYDGNMGNLPSVVSTGENQLECFDCHDASLYHDAIAFWDEKSDDLLCTSCHEKKGESGDDYIKVLTQH